MTYEAVDMDSPAESGGSGAPSIKLIILLLLAIALGIFFFQNGDSVNVSFLWMDVTWPLRSVIFISAVAGIIVNWLFTWQWRRARRRKEQANQ